MTENTDVVVIGGGYAGVMVANCLTQRDDVTVTLINPRPTFVERDPPAPTGGRVLPHACVHRRSPAQRIVVNLTCHSRAPGGVPLLLWMHA
jgi:choline dehydrogenase-like flavoprotein